MNSPLTFEVAFIKPTFYDHLTDEVFEKVVHLAASRFCGIHLKLHYSDSDVRCHFSDQCVTYYSMNWRVLCTQLFLFLNRVENTMDLRSF